MHGQNDPRIQALNDAAVKAVGEINYDPHFAGIAERTLMESVLFLARYDALRHLEQIPVVPASGRLVPREAEPIPMILFCPSCGVQHIDKPEGEWTNPPHKSHLCDFCGHVWRPADIPTAGVKEIQTIGQHDSREIVRVCIDRTARFRPQWRHKKRGSLYVEIGRGELQYSGNNPTIDLKEGVLLVAYKGEDNRVWFRLESEFEDGRFERVQQERAEERKKGNYL